MAAYADLLALAVAGLAVLALLVALLALRRRGEAAAELQRLRLVTEQALAAGRAEAETTRTRLADTERALTRLAADSGAALAAQFETMRTVLDSKLRELREGNDARLAEIQRTVNEQLHQAVEKQMNASFDRVIDQFAAVQRAMTDVQAVTAQIGDIKRLFSNVRTRGGWGETQLRVMLDDMLPAGSYEQNVKLREGSDEMVEFGVIMPMRGERVYLPVDAKFPVEDYERLVAAAEAGDIDAERAARRALERRVREEARKISGKYIVPPQTVEFAVMYLATDGLYAEIARSPGMIEEIGRVCRVLIVGPSLLPGLLRTIQLGHVTLALEQKADQIRTLLGATKTEMLKMDEVLVRLGSQAQTFTNTIERARRRTRQVGAKLRAVEAVGVEALELDEETEADA